LQKFHAGFPVLDEAAGQRKPIINGVDLARAVLLNDWLIKGSLQDKLCHSATTNATVLAGLQLERRGQELQ